MKAMLLAGLLAGAVSAFAIGTPASSSTGSVRLDAQPGFERELVTFEMPVYPQNLLNARVEGRVSLDAVVDGQGRVIGVTVIDSTHPDFAQAATHAVRHWRFVATDLPMEGGHRHVHVPIHFVIRDNE